MKQRYKDFLLMTGGTLIAAIGIYFFKFPNNFSTGGVSGLSVLLAAMFPKISAGNFVTVLNLLMLIIGVIFIGKGFSLRTAYCSILLSGAVAVFEIIFPITAPLTHQPILELFIATALSALGSALLFNCDASSGGTDIIAMIIKKHSSFNISKALFFADLVIVMLTGVVFGVETWLFSLIGFVAKIFLTNKILEGIHLSKYCTVITSPDFEDEICEFITNDLHRTATLNSSYTGVYGKDKKSVFLVALTDRQAYRLRRRVKEIDQKAFIIINNTCEITGKGFREMV